MKHKRLIAALATAGSLFAVGSAQAFAPAVAAGIGALVGAGTGAAQNQADRDRAAHEAQLANQPPAFTLAPGSSTAVLGGPPAGMVESTPAPRGGYAWQPGHFEVQTDASTWVPGHWVAN